MLKTSYETKSALRYNEGKLRYDLLPVKPIEDLVKVLTVGANKYEERNWEKGMEWSKCLASLKRHIAEYEKGADYDKESGLLHITHVMWNAMAINQYYHTHPEYDDRNHSYFKVPKIGLDIDDVLSNMTEDVAKLANVTVEEITHWTNPDWEKAFDSVREDSNFWKNLTVKTLPKDIPFEPHCYITKMDSKFTNVRQEWLNKNGFPRVPLYVVDPHESKLSIAKKCGLDLFVDDNFHTFVELNKNGIPCYLMEAPYNKFYDVGYKRIHSLNELANKLDII